ncbi:hypothetical protein [Streptomyces sp. NPDC055607]
MLGLDDEAFATIGAKLHKPKLRATAAAILAHGDEWAQLSPEQLAAVLNTIAGIGPWTAHAAAADFTGDFAIQPHSDLAVRT